MSSALLPHAPTSRFIFMKRFATAILIVIAALIGAAGQVATAPTLSAESPEAVAPAVRVTTVTPTPQRLKVRSQGSVMPRTESALVVEVDGRIEWVSEAMVSGGCAFRRSAAPSPRRDRSRPGPGKRRASRDQAAAELANARFEYDRLSLSSIEAS